MSIQIIKDTASTNTLSTGWKTMIIMVGLLNIAVVGAKEMITMVANTNATTSKHPGTTRKITKMHPMSQSRNWIVTSWIQNG
jgi:hypothetical protein